ncbi:MAG: rRNA maturation RNase YbeY [Planctomycetota bacterium]
MTRVEVRIEAPAAGLGAAEIRRVVEHAVTREGGDLALSVAVVDDRRIHDINRRYLDHDWPTDVITFDLRDDGEDDPEAADGEIVVSSETAAREAAERGHAAATELLYYCVHGVLHLLGWDDATDAERDAMLARQSELLGELGYEVST